MDIIDKLNLIISKKSSFVFKEINISKVHNETILDIVKEAIDEIKKLRENKYDNQFMRRFTKTV